MTTGTTQIDVRTLTPSVTAIDIAQKPEAAARYRISSTLRVGVVEQGGRVVREFHHYAPRRHDLDQIVRLATSA